MKEDWSDFEKYVFQKLADIQEQLIVLRTQAAGWGALAGIVTVIIAEMISRSINAH